MDRFRVQEFLKSKRVRVFAAVLAVLIIGTVGWCFFPHIHRKPPNIFDTPVDGVLSYLSTEDFNKLSVEERMDFIKGIVQRFSKMSQGDSAMASAFFAGLTGPANEKLIDNARILGKDLFVEGAAQYLALKTEQEKDMFIDQWIVKWVRFGEQATGKPSGHSDAEILSRMSDQARHDVSRGIDINADMAQQVMDFWDRDVASVASPKEQAQIFQFGPAIRQRLLNRSK